ncbi:amidase [Novosphingobium sp.]|uniref:amidase n=1 Tax=Novosphingobium sp. TaxID=1874826 RepID=UPI002FE16E88
MIDEFGAVARELRIGDGPVRVLVKDCLDIAGYPTFQGSAVMADAPPASDDANVVRRLRQDGSLTIVGKANMHEFAFGVTGANAWAGTPVNPRWLDRIPGGSSSGSAVGVAAGIADVAIGTDTGGSVRMPAACCGVVGFKPSFGLVSREGVHPCASTLDCVGVFAAHVGEVERTMATIAGHWTTEDAPATLRIGVLDVEADDEVGAAFADALTRLGGGETCRADSFVDAFDAGLTVMGAETWSAIGAHVDDPAMGEDVRGRVRAGSMVRPEDLAAAEAVRRRFSAEIDALLGRFDVLVLPTLPVVPPTIEEAADPRTCVPLTRLVRPFNLSGHPAVTLPLLSDRGLPVGLQIVGRMNGDARLCACAREIEKRLAAAS